MPTYAAAMTVEPNGTMRREPVVRKCRSLFISDVHLGAKGCQAELLLDPLLGQCAAASMQGVVLVGPRAGKQVLMEKPVERSVAAAERIVATCQTAGVKLGVIFQHRFRPASRQLAGLMADGALGALQAVHLSVPWWRPQAYYDEPGRGSFAQDGGGVLLTQAIHSLDLMLSLAGPVEAVSAIATTTGMHRMETEDFVGAAGEQHGQPVRCRRVHVRRAPRVAAELVDVGTVPARHLRIAHERGEPLNGVRETPDMETVAAQRLGQHIHLPHGAPVRRLGVAPRRTVGGPEDSAAQHGQPGDHGEIHAGVAPCAGRDGSLQRRLLPLAFATDAFDRAPARLALAERFHRRHDHDLAAGRTGRRRGRVEEVPTVWTAVAHGGKEEGEGKREEGEGEELSTLNVQRSTLKYGGWEELSTLNVQRSSMGAGMFWRL